MPRLTATLVARATLPPGRTSHYIRDSDPVGFGLRVNRDSKSFILERRVDGKNVRLRIGDASAWSVDEARAVARRWAMLIDAGGDPRVERERQRQAEAAARAAAAAAEAEERRRSVKTLGRLCDLYCDWLASSGKAASSRNARQVLSSHIPKDALVRPAADIRPVDVAAWMRTLREDGKHRTAGFLRSWLMAAFNSGLRAELDSDLPTALHGFGLVANPATPVPSIPRNIRAEHADWLDLNTIVLNLMPRTATSAVAALALTGVLLGGQRLVQLARTTVDDWDGTTLTVIDRKGRRGSYKVMALPAGPAATAILRCWSRRRATGLIFSLDGEQPVSRTSVNHLTRKLDGPSQLETRRGIATLLASLGVGREVRNALMSHGQAGVDQRHYQRHLWHREMATALEMLEASLLR